MEVELRALHRPVVASSRNITVEPEKVSSYKKAFNFMERPVSLKQKGG